MYRPRAIAIWKVLRGWSARRNHDYLLVLLPHPALSICCGCCCGRMLAETDLCSDPFWSFLYSQAHALVLLRREIAPRGRKKDETIISFYLGVTSFQRFKTQCNAGKHAGPFLLLWENRAQYFRVTLSDSVLNTEVNLPVGEHFLQDLLLWFMWLTWEIHT